MLNEAAHQLICDAQPFNGGDRLNTFIIPKGRAMSIELHLGDCLEYMRSMADKSVDAVITDPPYGIDYQSARRTDKDLWKPKIDNDKEPFLGWIKDSFRIVKDTGFLICFCRWDVEQVFIDEMKNSGYSVKSEIVWDKIIHGMGDLESSFAPQHETILFATKNGYAFPGNRPTSIIKAQRVNPEKMIHPNEKPVSLFSKLYRSLLRKNDCVIDLFMGSGASAEAAISFDIKYIGIDISDYYFPLTEKRIHDAQQQMRLGI
jgi:site-specific DNA-methyltransferase (adenine-specific)